MPSAPPLVGLEFFLHVIIFGRGIFSFSQLRLLDVLVILAAFDNLSYLHAIVFCNSSLLLQDAVEYAECEAVVKDYPPFREAMKKRGIEDMDLVMVDAWLV